MQDFQIDDLYRHRVVTAVSSSAGSDAVLLTVSRADARKDGYRPTLWAWRGTQRRIAVGSRDEPSSAQLAPDGSRFAWLARRKQGARQVRVQGFDEGAPLDVGAATSQWQSILQWSPDGRRLLMSRKIGWREDEFDDPAGGQSRPRVSNHLPCKQDGAGLRAGYRTQLSSLEVATGEQKILVQGDFDVQQAQWSPDGTRLAYVRTRGGLQRHWTELWLADADGADERRVLTSLPGINVLSWSPDGTRIAIAAGAIEGDALAYLYLFDVASGELRRATPRELHLESSTPQWHPDGRRVAVVANVRGVHEVCIVDADSGEVQVFRRGLRQVASLRANAQGLVYSAATMRRPNELFRCDWDGGDERRLSNYNGRWFAQRARPHVAKRRFTVPDGNGGSERIDAWVLTPARGDGPWPVYLDIHGGPHSGALIDFSNHFYWYLLLARGWMVVAPNAAGSSGYGDEFARRLRGRWGELDLPQFLAVLEDLRQRGLASGTTACGGKSYGGFLAAYAAGHCKDFEAIVISAPVADIESHFGTSDTGYYVTPYAMDGEIREHRERYHRLSPLQHIADTRAAILLLQGEDDQRCPLDQIEELFAALIRAQVPAKLVVYPGGTHSMAATGKPSHRRDYHRRVVHWVQRAIGLGGEAADARTRGGSGKVPASNTTETGAQERQVDGLARRSG